MLLATYALTTLTVEQYGERSSIDKLRSQFEPAAMEPDREALATQIEHLISLAELRHRRRWETSLAPMLRAFCQEASPGLDALELVGRAGLDMLPALRDSLLSMTNSTTALDRLRQRLSEYCQNLQMRISHEDELVRLAQAALPLYAWTRIGKEFLSQDAERSN